MLHDGSVPNGRQAIINECSILRRINASDKDQKRLIYNQLIQERYVHFFVYNQHSLITLKGNSICAMHPFMMLWHVVHGIFFEVWNNFTIVGYTCLFTWTRDKSRFFMVCFFRFLVAVYIMEIRQTIESHNLSFRSTHNVLEKLSICNFESLQHGYASIDPLPIEQWCACRSENKCSNWFRELWVLYGLSIL